MSLNVLKNEMCKLQEKLEKMEDGIETKLYDIECRELKCNSLKQEVQNIVSMNKAKNVITLNIGGKKFTTTRETLLSVKDSYFERLISTDKLTSQEIFIDRQPNYFQHIMDYNRNKKVTYKKITKNDIPYLIKEAEFYNIEDIYIYLRDRMIEIEFVSFDFSGPYRWSDGRIYGTNKVENLRDTNLCTGICTNTGGWIIVELNNEWDFEEIAIAGFTGNSGVWYEGNGKGGSIEVSTDRLNWSKVGTIPQIFGSVITNVCLIRSSARYIKFQNINTYLGLGYLNIKKIL
jgi:hypothetical protein